MHRWTSLIGAMLLALMLWTGGVAHAAERFDCIPATVEATSHIDGDRDQLPSAPDQGVTHHHSGCSGHHVGAPANLDSVTVGPLSAVVSLTWGEHGVPGRGPEAQLRPPIV